MEKNILSLEKEDCKKKIRKNNIPLILYNFRRDPKRGQVPSNLDIILWFTCLLWILASSQRWKAVLLYVLKKKKQTIRKIKQIIRKRRTEVPRMAGKEKWPLRANKSLWVDNGCSALAPPRVTGNPRASHLCLKELLSQINGCRWITENILINLGENHDLMKESIMITE